MRVSLVSSAAGYPATDTLAHLASYLLRRGDDVRLFTTGRTTVLPQPLPDMIQGAGVTGAELLRLPGFRASDLYVYHYVTPHDSMDTLLKLERGVVVLYCQPPNLFGAGVSPEQRVPDDLVRLASASDMVVVEDGRAANSLQTAGAAEPGRLHIVPPAVSLAEFAPGTADATLRHELNLLGKRVLMTIPTDESPLDSDAAQAYVARIRTKVPEAILAIAPHPSTQQSAPANGESGDIRVLPPADDLASYYRLADIYLTQTGNRASRQRALEAMACGVPVLDLGLDGAATSWEELAQSSIRLLSNDTQYGEAVRRSLDTAAQHSLEAFWQAWSSVIAEACGWLPVHLSADRTPAQSTPVRPAETATQDSGFDQAADYAFGIDMEQLKAMASVTLRDYEVRSPTPVFGPFIAWVRRNLTSHLRKPYLDPTLDRQEAFNLRAANALQYLATRLAAYEKSTAEREAALRRNILQMTEQIESLIGDLPVSEIDDGQAERIADIRSALAHIRTLLPKNPDDNSASAKD